MKDSSLALTLPFYRLSDKLVYLPGVTYRTVLPVADGLQILARFAKEPGMLSKELRQEIGEHFKQETTPLSSEARDSLLELSTLENLSQAAPMVVCLPGVKECKAGTICEITEVEQSDTSMVVYFKALYRAKTSEDVKGLDGEAEFTMTDLDHSDQFKENQTLAFDTALGKSLRLFANIRTFAKAYQNKAAKKKSEGDQLEQLLLHLSPLASLVHAELTSSETSVGLNKLYPMMLAQKRSSSQTLPKYVHLLQLYDVLLALFPFSAQQKAACLAASSDADRLASIVSCLDFGNQLFEDYLDVDYVVEMWQIQQQKTGKVGRTKFVAGYLRSLKQLLDTVQPGGKGAAGLAASADEDDEEDPDMAKVDEFMDKIDELGICEDGKRLLRSDYRRMGKMNKSSSDFQVLRTYMDVIMEIPWESKGQTKSLSLAEARAQLDKDHFGMDSVKERILEYLAVMQMQQGREEKAEEVKSSDSAEDSSFVIGGTTRTPKPAKSTKSSKSSLTAPILLLTGPPGVGKTSLAKSIATTLGRPLQRVSVGGLNDFADLKGHRRTYVGAIPGLIIQALRRAQTFNPVILLDEVDKISGANHNGNPEAALLEILDPEQNSNFLDHYVGFPVDLSQVVFICTANDQWAISDPLRDRMETIELSGYSYYEKLEICKRYIVPRQTERNSLPEGAVQLQKDAILKLATSYTRESGIRSLERFVASICRSKAIEYLDPKTQYNPVVTAQDLPKYVGMAMMPDNPSSVVEDSALYGMANGLSYNSDGSGSLLKFEMVGIPGGCSMSCTGNLGEVLLESAEIAHTLVGDLLNRGLVGDAEALDRYNNTDIHLHVPEGAVSKDGPSAGITMTSCVLSLILRRAIPQTLAMTGEITLTGKVLAIGGLKEKLLGAHLTGGIRKVIVPRANRRDIIEDYVTSVKDKSKMAQLTLEEEKLRKKGVCRVFGEPERWVQDKLGIELVYVEKFADVVQAIWNKEVEVGLRGVL